MKDRVNFYFAMLLITIAGSVAALLIVQVGTTDAIHSAFRASSASYALMEKAGAYAPTDSAR